VSPAAGSPIIGRGAGVMMSRPQSSVAESDTGSGNFGIAPAAASLIAFI